MLYGGILALVTAIMMFSFVTRRTLDLDVLRDRNPDFVTLADGAVRNGYTLKLMNRSGSSRLFSLTITGLTARDVKVIGLGTVMLPVSLKIEPDKIRTLRVLMTIDRGQLHPGSQAVAFVLTDPQTHEARTVDTVFVSGRQQ